MLRVHLSKNWFKLAASNLTERRSKELNKMKDFYRKEGTGTRKLHLRGGAESRLVTSRARPIKGWQGHQTEDVTSADQVTPD